MERKTSRWGQKMESSHPANKHKTFKNKDLGIQHIRYESIQKRRHWESPIF